MPNWSYLIARLISAVGSWLDASNLRNRVYALEQQNATNRQNIGGQYFDNKTGAVTYWYQASLIPILSYKLEF
jgi:hypothetical protein